MKEILNILIPMLASGIISIVLYLIMQNKKLAIGICLSILIIFTILIYLINKIESPDAENQNILKAIEANYKIGNYEQMLKIAEEHQLLQSECMLNVIGVMYAQGIYYQQSYKDALRYMEAATVYGELESSFINLWLISYLVDNEEKEDTFWPYKNCINTLDIAEKHNNYSLNEMLKVAIAINFGENIENGYEYVRNLSVEKKQLLFDSFYAKVGETRYIVCNEWKYYGDINRNTETGQSKYDNIVAIPCKLEERTIPIYIFEKGSPSNFILFEDIHLPPFVSSDDYTVTETFEYEPTYIDSEGNMCFWTDTDEIICRDVPPETDENSRWVITGISEASNVRKYKLQIKVP